MTTPFPANLLRIKTEILLNSVWTDISSFVLYRDPIQISGVSRTDETSSIQASQITLTLKNGDGRFTPNNSSGAYYPFITRNIQLRLSVTSESSTLVTYSGFRFWGEISSLPIAWDETARDVFSQITASGPWRRISQQQISLGSPFRRYYLQLTGTSVPRGYWPMEDANSSLNIVAMSGGTSNATFTGTEAPNFGSTSVFLGSDAIVALNSAAITFPVPVGGTATNNATRFLLSVPAGGDPASGTVSWNLAEVDSAGTFAKFELFLTPAGKLFVQAHNAGGTLLFTSANTTTNVQNKPLLVSMELTPSGGTINWALRLITPGAAAITESVTGSFTGTIGAVSQVKINRSGVLATTSVGHMAVIYTIPSLITAAQNPLNGWNGEFAMDRFTRICSEVGIGSETIGTNSTTQQMGPQTDITLPNMLQSVEDTDCGFLYESKVQFGLGYRARASMLNQTAALSLNYATGMLVPPLVPVYDDQLTHNSVLVTNYDGYVLQLVLATGAMSIQNPPNGIGDWYAYQRTINVLNDSQAQGIATHLLNIGGVNEDRYPTVSVDMSKPSVAALFSSIPSLRIGDFFTITNPPSAFLRATTINQLMVGYTETISSRKWTFIFNAIPESPWVTGYSPGTITVSQLPNAGAFSPSVVAAGSQNSVLNSLSLFAITALTAAGNAITVSALAPASPVTDAMWINSVSGLISQWNGSAWVPITFNASSVIQTGTVVASLVAAGTIIAGVVDGTVIQAAEFVSISTDALPDYVAYSGTPAADNMLMSFTPVAIVDQYGNAVLSGYSIYSGGSGAWFAINMSPTASGFSWYTSTNVHQTAWALQGELLPQANGPLVIKNSGFGFNIGTSGTNEVINTFASMVFGSPLAGSPSAPAAGGTLYSGGGAGAPFWIDEHNIAAAIDRGQVNTASTFTLSNGTTGETQFSSQFTADNNAATVGSELVCVIVGNGSWPATVLTLHVNMDGNLFCTVPIGAAVQTGGGSVAFRIVATIVFNTVVGAGSSLYCSFDGCIVNSSGNRLYGGGGAGGAPVIGFSSNTYNSSLSHAFMISGSFAAGGSAASITTFATRWSMRGGLG